MTEHFFATPGALRRWLQKNHARATELHLCFWKVSSGKRSVTYRQALDEALCFGWIDGVRSRIDEERWRIRFTPRRPRSIWSSVNIRRVQQLIAEGRMQPAGLAAFRARDQKRVFSYEDLRSTPLGEAEEQVLRSSGEAWAYFQAQRPSYRQSTSWWVMSARKPETRQRRLQELLEWCRKGEWLPQYRWVKR